MKDLRSQFPIYSRLLHLYPVPYRERFEEELLQTTADMLEEATTPAGRLLIWIQVIADLPANVGRQQLSYIGGTMYTETPQYLRRNSIVAGALLLPFICIILANSIGHHALSHTWLWHTPAMAVWLLYLPQVALLVTLITHITYLARSERGTHRSWTKRMFDLKHTWLLIPPLALALGILFLAAFHDSVQCWTQSNSVHAISHMQQAWNCTMQNKSTEAFRFF